MSEVKCEIKEHIGVIAERSSGWKRELNLVSWNGCPVKLGIRDWNPDHTQMSCGITLTEEEGAKLAELLTRR